MGTNQFQREYIEYLQERNSELLSRLNHLKESYENKILAKDLNKNYLISALEDVLSVCTAIPQEIDLFFDKMTAAMSVFKNILLKKSEVMQLMEKISKLINPTENNDNDLISVGDLSLMKEQKSEAKVEKKAGTVKVSPMINGHIISTEPRICLNRVPGLLTPRSKIEAHHLSPIIEVSPDTSSDPSNLGGQVFKEIKIPLERLNLNKMSYNYISEQESPKSRFKGPKTWKKSLLSNKSQSDHQKNVVLENNENFNKKFSFGEVGMPQSPENIDPLEGPSWLYKEISETNASSSRFIDYRRRKHRFATVFDKNEDCIPYFEEKSKKLLERNSDEFYKNHDEADDEKDLEESKERISENSEDVIGESFISEYRSSNSPKRKKCQSNRRVCSRESNNNNDTESVEDVKQETSTFYQRNENKTNTFSTSTLEWNSSENENNEKNSALRSSFNKGSLKQSFEKTPSKTEHTEEKNTTNKWSKSRKRKNTKDVILKLKNHAPTKEITPKKPKTGSPKDKNKSKSKSRSSIIFFSENEGRKRRKAAPKFKLVEPKLKTKLRRD